MSETNNKKNNHKKKVLDARHLNITKFINQKNIFIKKFAKFEEKANRVFLKPWFFIIILMGLSAGIVLGTVMYINHGVGAFNEIFVVAMLNDGLTKGEWTAIAAFASAYLIARVLEAPLVGILDIGGAIMTGVGMGIPAVILASNGIHGIMSNEWFGLALGASMGLGISLIILGVRALVKKGLHLDLGTDIMMGAGNQVGAFLSPLVIIAAALVNPIVGLGAAIGASLFFMFGKPTLGGAIIGAMILGIIPAFA